MKWIEIKKQYPDKFILLGDLVEEPVAKNKFRIVEGKVLKVSDDPKEIMAAYQQLNKAGQNVLFSLPTTPKDFVIENVPYKGVLK